MHYADHTPREANPAVYYIGIGKILDLASIAWEYRRKPAPARGPRPLPVAGHFPIA